MTAACSATMLGFMRISRVVAAGIAHPFGDERSVTQAFPNPIKAQDADPFLMCDYFNMPSDGVARDEDHFPIDWHPHRGMDILSYFRTGVGRHGDSLGNRETFATPGMQWMSVGSGVEHAEGGGTPAGQEQQGFQIWINVPKEFKMNDPVYGTEPPEAIPQEEIAPGAKARLLAGPMGERVGVFKTKASVQVIDFDLDASASLKHTVPVGMDCALLFIYQGAAQVNDAAVKGNSIVVFDAAATGDGSGGRTFELKATGGALSAILFAGKRIKEPIAWHGPIVMNTQAEIQSTFRQLREGKFPPVRVPWDYHYIKNKSK
mmetsp:Transcript_49663/g.121248  ORF Transcript_49663/g.121248 Transcript_49663/m.121248 type:complete len:318 (+) Transcript_49663:138-1091(+)